MLAAAVHIVVLSLVVATAILNVAEAELRQQFSVSEGLPPGTIIGTVGSSSANEASPLPPPPYLIVPLPGSNPDRDLNINQQTGVIRTRRILDRESTAEYRVSAIPLSGESLSVTIRVLDVNDNEPTFPNEEISVDIPENTPRGTRRQLPAAADADLGKFGTQRYELISGNDDGTFSLESSRDEDGSLALELVVQGHLDRETSDRHELRIVAEDGGSPSKTGTLAVSVRVQDLNDNPPVFGRQRYFASVPASGLSVGDRVARVRAGDADDGPNGQVRYSINRRQSSDHLGIFAVDENTGVLTLQKPLENLERLQQVHEIVVVARDGGEVAQESSAFVTVRLTSGGGDGSNKQQHPAPKKVVDSSDDNEIVDVIYANNEDSVSENVKVGEAFARVIVDDESLLDVDITDDEDGLLQLLRNSSGVFLAAKRRLDFEREPALSATLVITEGSGKKIRRPFTLRVSDANDHTPVFEQETYFASLSESVEPRTGVVTVHADDADRAGSENARVSYSLLYGEGGGEEFADWFAIDEHSGEITTQAFLDCETESNPQVAIVARDHGKPSLSATATLSVSVSDVNDHKPIFDSTYYRANLQEDEQPGECFLQVGATDLDCGVNSEVRYRIKETNVDTFTIDEMTGKICLAKHLDHERQDSYGFTVVASDKGGLSTNTMVRVDVLDVNDNAPIFKPSTYIAKLRSRFPAGEPFLVVAAEDPDSGAAGTVAYVLEDGGQDGLFRLDGVTGELSLARSLPSAAPRTSFSLRVRAEDGLGLKSPSAAKVEILVDDDDLSFAQPQFVFRTSEDVSPYTEVGRLENRRLSTGANLTIYDSNAAGQVSVDSVTGALRTEARLDHETRPLVVLNVRLYSDVAESFCQVVIKVLDVNDNAPDFGTYSTTAAIREDFNVGDIIYAGKANDVDSGDNGRVEYSMGEPRDDHFRVDAQTGSVILTRALDYENQQEHVISVVASDQGNPPLKTALKLHIQVHDVNDNSPVFDKENLYEIELSETYPVNTPIATLRATDADSGRNGRISYSLRDNSHVAVLRNSGALILRRPLDREFEQELWLTVIARDHGVPPLESSVHVTIKISDRNDNTPIFERGHYSFTISENLPAGRAVGTVHASDGDEAGNGQITYSLQLGSADFAVDSKSGVISTLKELDRESEAEYELLVEAIDDGSPRRSAQTLVTITVKDLNDNPPMLVRPVDRTVYVQVDSAIGAILGKVVAEDVDSTMEEVTFSVLDSNPVVSVSSNGDLRLLRQLPSKSSPTSVRIRLSDNGSPQSLFSTETLQLVPVEVGDKRSLLARSVKVLHLDRNAAVGTKVGSVALEDSGFRHNYLYWIQRNQNNDDTGHRSLYVNPLTGEVFVADELPRENFDFLVMVNSVSGEFVPSSVHVNVLLEEEPGPPSFSGDPITVSVEESLSERNRVVDLTKFYDRADRFQLIEQDPEEAEESFEVDEEGVLRLKRRLDYEQARQHLLTVRGFAGRHSADASILVNVLDINDNSPEILSEQSVTFPSDCPVHTPLLRLLVRDKDSGANGEVEVKIIDGNDDNTFELDPQTLDLSLKKAHDRNYYSLTVRASDRGSPPLSTQEQLTVKFEPSEKSSYTFSQSVYQASIGENASPDERVITVGLSKGALDDGDLFFSLLKGRENFYINERTGEIKTSSTSSLDRETQDEHALVVSLRSGVQGGRVTDTAVVYVKVDDVNDNSPVFGPSCRDLDIEENGEHTFVHAFVAHDPDLGDNGRVSYSLSEGDDSKFRIERDTGKLHSAPLDREEADFYHLTVIAIDNGAERLTAKCNVRVRVVDQNDNDPSFTQSIYSASVREDIQRGTEVLRVSATDPDAGQNADVRYSIENSRDDDWSSLFFAINERTGAIFTTEEPLDRERVAELRFDVLATDDGLVDIRSSRTQVKIIVTDANDHRPEFAEFPFRVNMSATPAAGVPLLRLSALDPDIGPNGQLTYNIVKPDQRERFHLSPEEGLLTVASSGEVAWEPGTVETLEVAVSDAGSPPRSSTGLVEILIEGGPAVALRFQQLVYEASVPERPANGRDVLQVRAVRSDGRRQRVIYSFLRGNDHGAFEINSNNGLIRVRDLELIDFESTKQFNLTISGRALGSDDEGRGLVAYTTCVITLEDINDHAPRFTREVYSVKVLEGEAKGTIVAHTKAVDVDQEDRELGLKYAIVEGNVDGAFTMDQEQPGLLRTNIVLDREIRDSYELTVSATDSGSPSLVGLAQVLVRVVDVNDNRPHFAPAPKVQIAADTVPGSPVATLRANDVDLAPRVTYRLKYPSEFLSIDVYTGQLISLKAVAEEEILTRPHTLTVIASDSKHESSVNVEVSFVGRRCRPEMSKPLYNFLVSLNATYPSAVGSVSVSSCDGDSNNNIRFEVSRRDQSSFSVTANGTVVANRAPSSDVTNFVLTAVDEVSQKRSSAVVAVTQTAANVRAVEFVDLVDTIGAKRENSDAPVAVLTTNQESETGLFFAISQNSVFSVDSFTGKVYSNFNEGGEKLIPSEVTVSVRRLRDLQSAEKVLKVIWDKQFYRNHHPSFAKAETETTLSENTPINTVIDVCTVDSPRHLANTLAANNLGQGDNPFVKILSGNEGNFFSFDSKRNKLVLSKRLSYRQQQSHRILLKMGWSNFATFSLCSVLVRVTKASALSDYATVFPMSSFVTSVRENAPTGTLLRSPPHMSGLELTFWSDVSHFKVDRRSGKISTRLSFDYEIATTHTFTLFANDSNSKISECRIEVLVESEDEFTPAFEQANYYFSVGGGAPVKGQTIGKVTALDRDDGPDGFVAYSLAADSEYFAVDQRRGVITVVKDLDSGVFGEDLTAVRRKRGLRDVRLVVNAKSLQPRSLEASTLVMISLEESLLPIAVKSGVGGSGDGVAAWLQGALVSIALLLLLLLVGVFFVCKRRKSQDEQARKFGLVASTTSASMELTPSGGTNSNALSRFPPQYSEIVSDYAKGNNSAKGGANTNPRSEISEKSHRSASSGRGSVEDGDDEVDVEIRMINEGGYLAPDVFNTSGTVGVDEDKLSEGSVQNTEEYLARLGIDVRKPPNLAGGGSTNGGFVVDHYSAAGGGSSIYNRIPDDTMSEKNSVLSGSQHHQLYSSRHVPPASSIAGSLSSIVHSEEELMTGSYNWDYLLDWGPQYQPLAHVFKEISRLKDDGGGAGGNSLMANLSCSATSSSAAVAVSTASSVSLKNPNTSHLLSRSAQQQQPPRSPISHADSSLARSALSPNFHPALSPLAAKSPSVSPMAVPPVQRASAVKNQRL